MSQRVTVFLFPYLAGGNVGRFQVEQVVLLEQGSVAGGMDQMDLTVMTKDL